MVVLLLCVGTLPSAVLGRLLFGRWYNHLSVYSVVWLGMLCLHELRLIRYYPLTDSTWALVGFSFAAFLLGSTTPAALERAGHPGRRRSCTVGHRALLAASEARLLRQAVVALSAISSLSIVYDLAITYSTLGSSMVLNLNPTYVLRLTGQRPSGIPYLGAMVLGAMPMVGLHAARHGLHITLVLPLLLVVAQSVSVAGRMGLVVTACLVLSGYVLGSGSTTVAPRARSARIPMLSLVAACVVAFWFISSRRALITSFWPHESGLLEQVRQVHPAFASVYSYLAGPIGVLNEYVKAGMPNGPFAGNSLAWLYRMLERMGLGVTQVPFYAEVYYTPIPMNAGTYLRYVIEDFGVLAAVVVPWSLAAMCSWLYLRVQQQRGAVLMWTALLAYLYTAVLLSWDIWPLKLTDWVIGLLVSVVACWCVDRRLRRWRLGHGTACGGPGAGQ